MSRAGWALAGLLILSACAPKPIVVPPSTPEYKVSLQAVPDGAAPKTLLGLHFVRRVFFYDAWALRKRKAPCRLSGRGDDGYAWYAITHQGVAEFSGGRKRVFVVSNDAGSGLDSVYLSLVDPAACSISGLTIVTPHNMLWKQTVERWGPDSDASERKFLEDMKFRFGYVGKEELDKEKDNPKFAYYFWTRVNGSIDDGPMSVRKYPGQPEQLASIEARASDERYDYEAEFKGGVLAYDRALDQYFVVFHPRDSYDWPTALLKAGPILVIGTRGEGLALVDMRGLRLRRLDLGPGDDDVRALELDGGKLRVNGKRLVPLPRLYAF